MIGMLHAFTHLYTVALLPLYLQIQQGLMLPGVEYATLLVTVMGLAYVLPAYPVGALADRFSRKKLLAFGLAVNAAGFIMLGFSPNYPTAIAGALIAGLGGSFYHPAATALVARLFPEGRGRALGFVGVGASAGFFLGPIYCGWRAAVAGDWRVPIIEIGVLGLVGALLFLWLSDEEKPLTEPEASETSVAPNERISPGADGTGFQTIGGTPLFPTRMLWFFFLAATLLLSFRDFAGQAIGTGASLFLQNAHGYGTKMAGLTLSAVFLMSAISNPLFGHLSDKGRLRWASLVLICGALLATSIPWLSLPMIIPAFLAYGFFFMASYPIIEAGLMESVPDVVRGRVFGLFLTIGGMVGTLSHWAVGEWVERLGPAARNPSGYYTLFALLGALILTSMAAFPFLHALRRREQERIRFDTGLRSF
jgi:MFS transporter, FSR family, fosmidomycin resistance protein